MYTGVWIRELPQRAGGSPVACAQWRVDAAGGGHGRGQVAVLPATRLPPGRVHPCRVAVALVDQ